jgi:ABC-type polysaccharide/polyol phosphate export permease
VTENINIQKNIIDPSIKKTFFFEINEIWQYREIFIALAYLDIKARYKQSVLGIV